MNNKNDNLEYEVILTNHSVSETIQIRFEKLDREKVILNGGGYFDINEEILDTTNLNIFDFCEKVSNDISFLKKISLKTFNEFNFLINPLPKEETRKNYDYEKKRISAIELIEEKDIEKSSILIERFLEIFNTKKITKKNWEDYSKACDLNKVNPVTKNIIHYKGKTFEHDGNENYINLVNNNFSIEYINNFSKTIRKSNIKAQNFYKCKNTKEIISIVIDALFRNNPNAVIRKCDNCGKLFVPKKSDTNCCNRISPQYTDKNCKKAREIILKQQKLENDPIIKLHKKIYDRFYKAFDGNRSEFNQERFEHFCNENAKLRDEAKGNEQKKNEYYNWLKQLDANKGGGNNDKEKK